MAGRPLQALVDEVEELYLQDERPWVIGFSGGKDSTAVLQIIYSMLLRLSAEQRSKPVFVVSSDTRVETPLVIDMLDGTLDTLNAAAAEQQVPLEAHRVSPEPGRGFWVNLLGKGYAAPTKAFRWCTERMKIAPVDAFILGKVAQYGEVIVILGARSAESASRAQVIAKHRAAGARLARHVSLSNAYVYTPIHDWSADEVWEYLMSAPRPWGGDNRALLELYRGSNAGECPIVIDTSTPSCGNSRFGCWTCTVVTKDKAMESLVEQGEDWMRPLLEFRNMLAATTDPARKEEYRNERRRNGKVAFKRGDEQQRHVPGGYRMRYRQEWLERLLTIERDLQAAGHEVTLINEEELHLIRREWRNDPIEADWSDMLPAIYRRVYGRDLDWSHDDVGAFGKQDLELLQELCADAKIDPNMVRKLLDLELEMDGLARRRGMSDRIHAILSEDWQGIEGARERVARQTCQDGGYQEEIDRLRAEMQALDDDGHNVASASR